MCKCPYCDEVFENMRGVYAHKGRAHREECLDEKVEINGNKLDITQRQLILLRKSHNNICDVCGKVETANTRPDKKSYANSLCTDHDHNTNQFRGFLCVQCNRNFGWYDKYRENIEKHASFSNLGSLA